MTMPRRSPEMEMPKLGHLPSSQERRDLKERSLEERERLEMSIFTRENSLSC